MTWPESITEMVWEEFASAQRRRRGIFDVGDAAPVRLEPRVDVVVPRPRRRIVSGRSNA